MARSATVDGWLDRAPGFLLRALGAAASVFLFAVIRDDLSPEALVVARFGLGIVLFALLVDVGRAIAGTNDAVEGDLGPHVQRADPMVDQRYRRVHSAVERFLEHGVVGQRYRDLVEEAFEARGLPRDQRTELLAQAEETAGGEAPGHRSVGLGLASGFLLVAGTTVTLGILLEGLNVPLRGALTAIAGLGTVLLQLRTVRARAQVATAAVGFGGAALLGLGGSWMASELGAGWQAVTYVAVASAILTGVVVLVRDPEPMPWSEIAEELEDELASLRRAFLVTLATGVVLFPFEPLLAAFFEAMGWPLEVPYRIAVAGFVTATAFLGAEMVAAWYALRHGRRRARQLHDDRVAAHEAILDALDRSGTATSASGGQR